MEHRKIVEAITTHTGLEYTDAQLEELNDEIAAIRSNETMTNDFYVYLDGTNYLLIHSSCIWEKYVQEIKELVVSNYVKTPTLPDFIVVDWDETARAYYRDEYGEIFAVDGNETKLNDWYVFTV